VKLRVRAQSLPSPVANVLVRGATFVLVVLSSIGLLSIPLGEYDDSILLVGARLVLAGKLPYVDFYANYGPFQYTFLASFLEEIGRPALALRWSQILLLAILAFLSHGLFNRRWVPAGVGGSELPVPLIVLGLSMVAAFPSFIGFSFALVALLLFLSARNSTSKLRGVLLAALGGIALALTTLTRPAFGAYVGAAVFLSEAIRVRHRSSNEAGGKIAWMILFAGAVVSGSLIWLALYRAIPPSLAFQDAVLGIYHILSGGARYLDPEFLRRGVLEAFAAGCAVTGASSVWGFAVPTRGRRIAGVLLILGGALPILFKALIPGRPLAWLGFVFFAFPIALAYSQRRLLRDSPDMAAAALFGVAAGAFGHYAWTRPDAPHLLPSLCLASFGTAFVLRRFRPWPAVAVLCFLVLSFQVAVRGWYWTVLPIARIREAGRSGLGSSSDSPGGWGCEKVNPDIAKAVKLADHNATPESRFVAVASSHMVTQGNPVILFLLSTRLPYTRWFHYDPGLQSSAAVQKEMEAELVAAGSRTAVVWRADRFLFDRNRTARDATSRFDEFFKQLYPVVVERFGDYEVRARDHAAAATDR
jgi:hypothetical protein